jgi:SNF2 family DNA or RNA helicase
MYPKSKTEPWNHQVEALSMSLESDGFFLAHDMGSGKTKTAIDICTAVDAGKILVLSPLSVVDVWPEQFAIHSAMKHLAIPLNKGSVAAKAEKLRKDMRLAAARGQSAVAVVNYESAWREPLGPSYNAKGRLIDKGVLLKTKWDLVILDESHRIKSPGGKASWFCKRLGPTAKKRLCLSGTPMPHSPLDVYAQFRFLDPEVFGTSFVRFRARYAIMGGFEGKQVVDYQNLEDLQTKFYSIAHRVTKEEVLELPPVTHIERACTLSAKAMRAYSDLESELIAKIKEGEVTVSNALVKLLRLQQITGGSIVTDDGDHPVDIDSAKLNLLRDILEDLQPDEPVIIFTRFVREMERIKEMAGKMGRKVSELSGASNELKAWQRGETSVIVVQIQTGGLGVDLTRSRYCIYYSLGFSLGDFLQSLARMDRPGQTRKGTYYHLIAKGTIDEKVYASLKAKKRVVEDILQKVEEDESEPEHRSDQGVRRVGRVAA